ncbi:type II toxin-antitoxin system VapB family antitoxin [Aquidulcibacter sp.]|uniref:type II toxin-antitoxin system VapB family antitoxin n=1 Tax=Aquidulcibacter sp. TaxID=2052990 RepID=UPI0025BF7603|nr:type II toxin-antitoxin system VapB family antitoxin [Aquidulcibacter sp.]MCA3692371.1 type II toxin-antitoxin system VapB family antitoxin [Aquidulcibacter sp.]
MPTEVHSDESLVAAAMMAGGFSTRQEAVETALRELLERRRRVHGLRALHGKIEWIGDLDALRLDRPNEL